jgi:hypothetical protein
MVFSQVDISAYKCLQLLFSMQFMSTPAHHAALTLQVLVLEMLKAWGDAGLCRHVEDMQRSYARRAAVTVAAADKHLQGLASWRAPQVGLPVPPHLDAVDVLIAHVQHPSPYADASLVGYTGFRQFRVLRPKVHQVVHA